MSDPGASPIEQEFMNLVSKPTLIVQTDTGRLLKELHSLFNLRVFA